MKNYSRQLVQNGKVVMNKLSLCVCVCRRFVPVESACRERERLIINVTKIRFTASLRSLNNKVYICHCQQCDSSRQIAGRLLKINPFLSHVFFFLLFFCRRLIHFFREKIKEDNS